jgi:hypothetical protein
MKTFNQLLREETANRRYYVGEPLETGGTSISANVAPMVKYLFDTGKINSGDTVFDYGAGKYGRNSTWLREQGCNVFAFDPYNGTTADGWEGVAVQKPKNMKFDVVFSAYVLNVVPEHIECGLLKDMKRYVGKGSEYHVTRNKDIFDTVKGALDRKDPKVGRFFLTNFANCESDVNAFETKTLSDARIKEFCIFGVQTSRGFQRVPLLEEKGYKLMRNSAGFKLYTS